jgi:hypothetical protein
VTRRARAAALGAAAALVAAGLSAQAFNPPPVQRPEPGTNLGLYGFGVRAGADVGAPRQLVLGLTLDAGSIGVPRVRLRPSVELGFANGPDTYTGSLEILYRFRPDGMPLVPYVGAGPAVRGQTGCQADVQCPAIWVNAVAGLEVRFRSTFNWLVEYHGLDLFRHGRLELGLTTRRGG